MKYQQAKIFISEHGDMIGTTNPTGFMVSTLLIVPIDEKKRSQYINSLVHNSNLSLLDSMTYADDEDVEIWAVDTEHLEKANILFYDVVEK